MDVIRPVAEAAALLALTAVTLPLQAAYVAWRAVAAVAALVARACGAAARRLGLVRGGVPDARAQPHSVLITGSASGIGAGLALRYAKAGVTLHLSDRAAEGLEATAAAARAAGATVYTTVVDVTNRDATGAWVRASHERAPLDLVIACAGIAAVTAGVWAPHYEAAALEMYSRVFDVNLFGVLHTVCPAVDVMKARGSGGQVAIIGSLAGWVPLVPDPAYSGSKAAVLKFGRALRHALWDTGVRVNVVTPGFIKTPLTDAVTDHKPLQVTLGYALDRIVAGLAADDAVIVFPPAMHVVVGWMASLPWIISDAILSLGHAARLHKQSAPPPAAAAAAAAAVPPAAAAADASAAAAAPAASPAADAGPASTRRRQRSGSESR